jgi:hypothetical protein
VTVEERRATLSYQYRMLVKAPDMGAPPIASLWPADIPSPTPHGEPDPEWTDEQMDRIADLLNSWGT